MNIYDLQPIDMWGETFAGVNAVDRVPWKEPDEQCKKCFRPIHRERMGPVTIAWVPGSDRISDFIWCGGNDHFIVTERVRDAFEAAGLTGYVAWPVKMREPAKRATRRRPIVRWPYTGPALWDICITERVHVIPRKSTLNPDGVCPKCGTQKWTTVPFEAGQLRYVVDGSSWSGSDFMLAEEVNGHFVTERVVEAIRRGEFTNVEIRYLGKILGKPSAIKTIPSSTGAIPSGGAHYRCEEAVTEATSGRAGTVSDRNAPETREELATMRVELPPLDTEQTSRHPEFIDQLIEYLRLEEDQDLSRKDLTFLRSAQVGKVRYWIWRYQDTGLALCYATVSERPDGTLYMGSDSADGLSPEQYILAEHEGWF